MSALGSPFGSLRSPFGSPFSTGSGSPLTLGGPFSGHTGFGFNIPLGDPAAIDSAATDMQTMGDGFHDQARSIRVAASVAVEGDGGWKGSASAAFADFASHLINVMNGNATACHSAAKAISQLGHALSHAQKVTQQALGDCEKFSTEVTTQQGLANDAATAEQNANQNAANATHPSVIQTYSHQASVAHDDKVTAQNAVTTAQGNLKDAEKRGHDAEQTYQQEAAKLSTAIGNAASELRSPPDAGKAAPVPVTSSGNDILLASMVTLLGSMGAVKGPLIDAVPPSERTPGFVNALIQDQRARQEKEMHGGGARGPYSLWSNEFFGKDAGAVNAQVEAGKMPPMPSNWGSMTGAQRQQYLWSTHSMFPGMSCPISGTCTFVNATGTGARTPPQVVNYIVHLPQNVVNWAIHHPGQAAEVLAGGVCTVAIGAETGDVVCLAATGGAYGVDTAVNAAHAESFGNFWAHQGVTTAEYVVGGGGGVIRSGVGAAKLLEFKVGGETVSVLPTSVGGRIALNTYFAAPGAAVTAVSPKIDHAVFGPEPPPPTHPHG
jgi:hypothetical protein